MRLLSSRARQALAGIGLPLCGVGFVLIGFIGLVGACSSGGGQATTGDSGASGDDASNTDATQSDGGLQLDSSQNDGGTSPDTSGGGDTGTGDDGSADAPFAFDGFMHADGYGEASYCPDDDGDGFTVCDGDCNDHDSLINPCAFDTNLASGDPVGRDGLDNDCDGTVDNLRICDNNIAASGHDVIAGHYAWAADICDNADPRCKNIIDARFYGPNNANAHRVTKHMGTGFTPHKGTYMTFLATGVADDDTDTPSYRPGDGTDLMNSYVHPSPLPANQNVNPCNTGRDESTVAIHDYTELRLTLRAPRNAGSFTFDFNFFSEEYPVYVCKGFNDTFLAMLTSQQYPQPFQIAFDPMGHRVNVNNSFFQDCTSMSGQYGYNHTCTGALALLAKTGYEIPYTGSGLTMGNGNFGSGATDWLKTTAPIQPGETFTLSFVIFDEADGILDSAVILDNFRWNSTTLGSPVTGR